MEFTKSWGKNHFYIALYSVDLLLFSNLRVKCSKLQHVFHYVTSLEIALLCKKKGNRTGKGINDVCYVEIICEAEK